MDKDREEREHILIKIKKLRRMLRNARDPGAARAIDCLLRAAEARLAGLREQWAAN